MLAPRYALDMYKQAAQLAALTPEVRKLAGNCTTVSYGMLGQAHRHDAKATLAIGWVDIDGTSYFDFTDAEFQGWKAGSLQTRYRLHCWIALPTLHDVLDLTLPSTLREIDADAFAELPPFLTRAGADAAGVTYHTYKQGDDVLLELNLIRSVNLPG